MNRLSFLFVLILCVGANVCSAKGAKTLIVADRKVACAGTFECIQIREKASAPWRVYADTIEGFSYEEGYEYKISVQPLQAKNTTLEGIYEEKYKLLKVISKRKTGYNPAEELTAKRWILKELNDTRRNLGIPDTNVYIAFNLKTGKTMGRAVCNNFTSSFSCQGHKISITNIAATKMMCKGQALENVIFNFYKGITTFKIQGNILTLTEPDGSFLQFEGK